MKVRDVVSFAVLAAIIIFVLADFATLGIRVKPPPQRTNLSMEIPDINGIVPGSNVLLRGVPVGKVSNVSTALHAATIDFYVERRYKIPVDSQIRIENLSALGETYIGLIPRSAGGPMLHDGQHIDAKAVTQPPSISELAASVVRVLNQLDPKAMERIISEGNIALPDPAAVLPNISRAITRLRNTLADFHGKGRAVLDNVQTLLDHSEYAAPAFVGLTPRIKEIGVYLQDFSKHFSIFGHRDEPANLFAFNNLIKRVQDFLDNSADNLKLLGEAFLPKLNMIGAALMNFDTSQILGNILDAVPPDGTITLRVVP